MGLPPERFAPNLTAIHNSLKQELANLPHIRQLAVALGVTESTIATLSTQLQRAEAAVADHWQGEASAALMRHVREILTKVEDMKVFLADKPADLLLVLAQDIEIAIYWVEQCLPYVTWAPGGHRLSNGSTDDELVHLLTPMLQSLMERYSAVQDALNPLAASDWA